MGATDNEQAPALLAASRPHAQGVDGPALHTRFGQANSRE